MIERARDLQLQTLTVEQRGRVLTVRVVAPPYNFMTAQMHRDFDALTRSVDDDESVGAVVVTGGVEKRYITHFDIADILAAAERPGRPLSEETLRNIAHGIDVVSAIPGGERALERSPLTGLLDVNRFSNVVLRIGARLGLDAGHRQLIPRGRTFLTVREFGDFSSGKERSTLGTTGEQTTALDPWRLQSLRSRSDPPLQGRQTGTVHR